MSQRVAKFVVISFTYAISLGNAHGAVLPTHGFVGIEGGDVGSAFRVSAESTLAKDTGLYQQARLGTYGAARASVDPNGTRLLRTFSEGYGGLTGLFDPAGYGIAVASWRDIAYLHSGLAPASIRLQFAFEGDLAANVDDPNPNLYHGGFAEFGISWTTQPMNYFDASQGGAEVRAPKNSTLEATDDFELLDNAPNGLSYRGPWDFAEFDFGRFRGKFHIDVPYVSSLGGYGWGLTLSSVSVFKGGSAYADALGTLQLQAATTIDGAPIDLTFDSGLRINSQSVPEPSSLALLGSGALGLLGCQRRRRSSRATALA